jgi:hypothetical protein
VNKKIIIMPRQMVRGVLPAVIFAGLAAVGIKIWTLAKIRPQEMIDSFAGDESILRAAENAGLTATAPKAMADASQGAAGLCVNETILGIAQSSWLWFLTGALTALLVYLIWNFWRRR